MAYYKVGHIQPCLNFEKYNKIISSHPIATYDVIINNLLFLTHVDFNRIL